MLKSKDEGWIPDVYKMNQVFSTMSFGLFSGNEIYMKLGVADLRVGNFFDGNTDFYDGYKPAMAVGVKQSFLSDNGITLGMALQYTTFSDYKDETVVMLPDVALVFPDRTVLLPNGNLYASDGTLIGNIGTKFTTEYDITGIEEYNAALTTGYVGKTFAPYIGITASRVNANEKLKISSNNGTTYLLLSSKYREKNSEGVICGLTLREGNLSVNVEAQIYEHVSYGLNINYYFPQ